MPEAAGEVVVDHADRLHEGVDDRRPDEVEALGLERLRDRARGLVLGPDIGPARGVVLHRAAIDEPPQEIREALPLLDREPSPGAGDRAEDLLPVADDAGVAHQRLDVLGAEGRDHGRIEAGKGAAEILALPQDRDPGQPGLEAVEDQLLKQRPFAPVPTLPSLRSPAVTSDQGSAVKPSSYTTGTMRVRAVPRCCMRDTTSWPM